MNQSGVSFLEVIAVVGILMIVSAFVAPNIVDWRNKRFIESDFYAVVSQIDYLKTRTRTVNGTAVLICNSSSTLTYQVSTNPQVSTSAVSSGFTNQIVENPSSANSGFNILSGKSSVAAALCSGSRGIFISNGLAGLEGNGGPIDIEVNYGGSRTPYGAYRILVNQSTGFVQKFKWNQASGSWIEQD